MQGTTTLSFQYYDFYLREGILLHNAKCMRSQVWANLRDVGKVYMCCSGVTLKLCNFLQNGIPCYVGSLCT